MAKEKKDPVHTYLLRIPQSLKDKLEAKAKKNRRSVNSEALVAIEAWVDN